MKIIADKTRCAGHARCAAVADQLFELDGNGYIAFHGKDRSRRRGGIGTRGVRACPERGFEESPTNDRAAVAIAAARFAGATELTDGISVFAAMAYNRGVSAQ